MVKMKRKYKRIINGASLLGLGIATLDVESTLILEQSIHIAKEHIATFCVSKVVLPEQSNTFVENLYQSFVQQNMIINQRIYMPNTLATLSKLVDYYNMNIFFSTTVIAYKQLENQNYEITAVFQNKIYTFECEQYIDTVMTPTLAKEHNLILDVTTTALIHNEANDEMVTNSSYTLTATGKEYCWVLGLKTQYNNQWHSHRATMLDFMQKSNHLFKNCKLLHIADALTISAKPYVKKENNYLFIPAFANEDVFSALTRGTEIIGGAL